MLTISGPNWISNLRGLAMSFAFTTPAMLRTGGSSLQGPLHKTLFSSSYVRLWVGTIKRTTANALIADPCFTASGSDLLCGFVPEPPVWDPLTTLRVLDIYLDIFSLAGISSGNVFFLTSRRKAAFRINQSKVKMLKTQQDVLLHHVDMTASLKSSQLSCNLKKMWGGENDIFSEDFSLLVAFLLVTFSWFFRGFSVAFSWPSSV